MADTADNPIKKSIFVSKAPPPPTILRGSFVPTPPKPTEGLDHLPTYYPAALTAKTNLIICRAMRKFPVQPEILELCKYVVKELTPVFRDALQNGALRQDEALGRMHDLVYSLLVHNCEPDTRRYELKKEVQRSEEWLTLAEMIAGPHGSNRAPIHSGPNRNQPVSGSVAGDLGEWAESRLPKLRCVASRILAGDTPDILRSEFEPLFAEVIDRLEAWRKKQFFDEAQYKRLTKDALLEYLSAVKQMKASTLNDYIKKYRHKSRVASVADQPRQ